MNQSRTPPTTASKHSPHTGPCREIFDLLSQYLDVELPPEACHEIEAHIEDCPPCIEFTDSLKKTIALCRQYAPSEIPAPLSESSRKELEAAYQRMLAARFPAGANNPGESSSS